MACCGRRMATPCMSPPPTDCLRCSGSWGSTRCSPCSCCSCSRAISNMVRKRRRVTLITRRWPSREARNSMATVWFVLVTLMLAGYVVLDGFDLGAGALHLIAAKTEEERRAVIRSIGPVWDGNEVWLLAAGGTLYFAFPLLYASSFSGFYLPLMMVLWLLMLRAIGIEFRTHLDDPVWRSFFDVTFSAASV